MRRNQRKVSADDAPAVAQAFCSFGSFASVFSNAVRNFAVSAFAGQLPSSEASVESLKEESLSSTRFTGTTSPAAASESATAFARICSAVRRNAGTSKATHMGLPIGFPRITAKGCVLEPSGQKPPGVCCSRSVLRVGYQ